MTMILNNFLKKLRSLKNFWVTDYTQPHLSIDKSPLSKSDIEAEYKKIEVEEKRLGRNHFFILLPFFVGMFFVYESGVLLNIPVSFSDFLVGKGYHLIVTFNLFYILLLALFTLYQIKWAIDFISIIINKKKTLGKERSVFENFSIPLHECYLKELLQYVQESPKVAKYVDAISTQKREASMAEYRVIESFIMEERERKEQKENSELRQRIYKESTTNSEKQNAYTEA